MWRPTRTSVACVLASACLLAGAAPALGQEIIASVAISLKEAVERLGQRFGESHPGVTIRFNFGGSGELQKQIEAGAPVDLFISAGEREMGALERRGLVRPGSRRLVARNVLTVVKPAGSRFDLARPADFLDAGVRRIAIGSPRTVPVGQYAEQSLRALGLWDRIQPKLILTENVRQVLEYVTRGEVDAGFVYVTDAMQRAGPVKEAFRPPEDTYSPVVYPLAVMKDSRRPEVATAFAELLLSAEGQAALARLGFQPPSGKTR